MLFFYQEQNNVGYAVIVAIREYQTYHYENEVILGKVLASNIAYWENGMLTVIKRDCVEIKDGNLVWALYGE